MVKKEIKNDVLVFDLNTKIYPKEAIFGACFVFIDRAYFFLDSKKKDEITVKIKRKNTNDFLNSGEFHNELLNFVHRINIAKQNKKIREYIVERALYSSIDNSAGLDDEEFDDPLDIAVPWEEKYGDNKSE
ncbi:His-Xaa-Ser system protein HxsD [bacterium]|nr:His-Xaa-Ser system protein HxsD [bacterium]